MNGNLNGLRPLTAIPRKAIRDAQQKDYDDNFVMKSLHSENNSNNNNDNDADMINTNDYYNINGNYSLLRCSTNISGTNCKSIHRIFILICFFLSALHNKINNTLKKKNCIQLIII